MHVVDQIVREHIWAWAKTSPILRHRGANGIHAHWKARVGRAPCIPVRSTDRRSRGSYSHRARQPIRSWEKRVICYKLYIEVEEYGSVIDRCPCTTLASPPSVYRPDCGRSLSTEFESRVFSGVSSRDRTVLYNRLVIQTHINTEPGVSGPGLIKRPTLPIALASLMRYELHCATTHFLAPSSDHGQDDDVGRGTGDGRSTLGC